MDNAIALLKDMLGAREIGSDGSVMPESPRGGTAHSSPAERRTETPTTPPASQDIIGFRGEYYFLSNFSHSPASINFRDVVFLMPTGEHLFHGMKIAAMTNATPKEQLAYLSAMSKAETPGEAKRLGRRANIDVQKWNSISESCMRRTVDLKFSQNDDLRKKLLATGDVKLVEENDWGDKLWGTVNGEGKNLLGKILMEYRDHIRNHR